MKQKTAYVVMSKTDTGKGYLVKSNFGSDEDQANRWADDHASDVDLRYNEVRHVMAGGPLYVAVSKYPNGLHVKKLNY